ncbi:MAG: carboxypeptidase M32 [Rhodothermales bacterium]
MPQTASEPAVEDRFARLREIVAQVSDLRRTAEILSWDQETYMPPGGAEARAKQISTIRRLAHERFTTDELGTLLDDLSDPASEMDPQSVEASMVRVLRRDYDKATRLPNELVGRMAEAVSRGKQAWKKAREMNRFETFAPHLERIVDLNVEKAEAYGYDDRIYDALLDDYEPGMKTSLVEKIFSDLRKELVPIVEAIADAEPVNESPVHQHFDKELQWQFGLDVARDFGYDLDRGRQDLSAHPFTTTFAISDVRVTTRVSEHFLNPALFGTLHEAGHALYEQGVDPSLARTLLDEGTSLGMHESQSRLWENLVGRSRPFWERYYTHLRDLFPEQLGSVTQDAFYGAVNKVQPGLIRVEADEVTYNLHIMLRFEIENALLEGRVATADLPDLWNEKMDDYLGVVPDTDANGVLQDIHWSLGAIGYFPTYALGNLMSTQIFEAAGRDLGDMDALIRDGRFGELLDWLRKHIHRHGRKMKALDLLERATGSGLSAKSWLAYVRRKYGRIYPELARRA